VRHIEELVVSTKNNQPLQVKDVADVKVGHQDRVLSIGFEGPDGKPADAVVITVFRRLGGNTVNISRDIHELLANRNRETASHQGKTAAGRHARGGYQLTSNIRATVVYDQATFVDTAVGNVLDAIVVGGVFSVLILLAFLRSWRATLISALAIPTTLAITFL